jgi:hypothetical protein
MTGGASAYKKLEEKYPLTEFKVTEKGGVEGKIGPHGVNSDKSLDVIFILGNINGGGRQWVSNLLPGGFFFSVVEGKKGLTCPVHMLDDKPHFQKNSLVDGELFARATSTKNSDPFLSLNEVKKAFELYGKGKLSLAEYGNDKLAKERLKTLEGIVKYGADIEEAAQVFLQADRIKDEARKLKNERGEIKPLTEEKLQILVVIDSIKNSGGRATPPAIVKSLNTKSANILEIGLMRKELEEEGYIKVINGNERVLTDLGRAEVEKYNQREGL